jgi:hypothetical protein
VAHHPFDFYRVWRKGEQRTIPGRLHADSGACIMVSNADFDEFDLQVRDAIAFLELHGSLVAKASCFPGVEHAVFDFAVELREVHFSKSSYLPPRLIQLAAVAGIGVEISHYACSDDEG